MTQFSVSTRSTPERLVDHRRLLVEVSADVHNDVDGVLRQRVPRLPELWRRSRRGRDRTRSPTADRLATAASNATRRSWFTKSIPFESRQHGAHALHHCGFDGSSGRMIFIRTPGDLVENPPPGDRCVVDELHEVGSTVGRVVSISSSTADPAPPPGGPCVLLNHGEAFLKGRNKRAFIDRLHENLRVALRGAGGTTWIKLASNVTVLGGEVSQDELVRRARWVIGFHSVQPAVRVPSELPAITDAAVRLAAEACAGRPSFAVQVRRRHK